MSKKCLHCQVEISHNPKNPTQRFCSTSCSAKSRTGEKNSNWKGGVHHRQDGYILVRKGVMNKECKGKRYDLQHRLIMEQHLGRELKDSEVVHHKNEDTKDNRIENLELIESQSFHAKLHDSLRVKNNKGQYA